RVIRAKLIRLAQPFRELFNLSVSRNSTEAFAVVKEQGSLGDVAQLVRFFQYRIEHRREIAGRGVDDTKNLGCGRLLLQCLSGFGDKPCVLDCNDRLIGKCAHQFYLPIREWLYSLTRDVKYSDQRSLAQQRYSKLGTNFSDAYCLNKS